MMLFFYSLYNFIYRRLYSIIGMRVGEIMRRKYANKIKWKKVRKKEYNSIYYEDEDFRGYIAYIKFLEVESPLVKNYFGREMITADKDYIWLEIFPLDKKYCITAKYNDKKELIKWYIDIVSSVGLDDGVPYMEDMYLDLDISPRGEINILDRDELDMALRNKSIKIEEYNLALDEMNNFVDGFDLDIFKEFSRKLLEVMDI